MATSNTSRTLQWLREHDFLWPHIVEKWEVRKRKKLDLWGFIDIVAMDPRMTATGVVGVQSCGADFKAHMDKIMDEDHRDAAAAFIRRGNRLILVGWRKVKKRRPDGTTYPKAMVWTPRVHEFRLDHFGAIK